MKPCDEHIRKTIHLADDMIRLADNGDAVREDTGCGILFGILRDYGYKLKQMAEQEMDRHRTKGIDD